MASLTTSLVSPLNLLTGAGSSSLRDRSGDESEDGGCSGEAGRAISGELLRICERCFFKSASVPALMVTDTWMLIFCEVLSAV